MEDRNEELREKKKKDGEYCGKIMTMIIKWSRSHGSVTGLVLSMYQTP